MFNYQEQRAAFSIVDCQLVHLFTEVCKHWDHFFGIAPQSLKLLIQKRSFETIFCDFEVDPETIDPFLLEKLFQIHIISFHD
jgi:hypothetical protein